MIRNGFTLLELLVALAVFSIAALSLLRLDGVAVATAADLSARGGSALVAENEAALIATDPSPPVLGTSTRTVVNGGRTFVVRQQVVRTPDPRLVRINLDVRDLDGHGRSVAMLVDRVR